MIMTSPYCLCLKLHSVGLDPELLLLKRDDLLGPKELDVAGSKPLQQLAGLRGLGAVKASVNTLLGLLRSNAELEEQERPLKEVCLNRVFLGNPGTGAGSHAAAVDVFFQLCAGFWG
jgi:hypothetical protein